ncbi:MAG: hypothetical protein JJE09_06145 [Bacteroidia bacterium]|nr:hypothetical protein [Bacteroidia bacterium]
MTARLFVLLFLITFSTAGQESISYEQVAWEFYNDKILKGKEIKKGTTFWGPTESHCYLFRDKLCSKELGFNVLNKEQRTSSSENSRFTYTHLDRFKLRDPGRGKFPRVYMTMSFSNHENQQIVTVVEEYKKSSVFYHIEMLDDGKIKNWCSRTWGESSNPPSSSISNNDVKNELIGVWGMYKDKHPDGGGSFDPPYMYIEFTENNKYNRIFLHKKINSMYFGTYELVNDSLIMFHESIGTSGTHKGLIKANTVRLYSLNGGFMELWEDWDRILWKSVKKFGHKQKYRQLTGEEIKKLEAVKTQLMTDYSLIKDTGEKKDD